MIWLGQARQSARTESEGFSIRLDGKGMRSGLVQAKSEGVDLILTQDKIWDQYSHSLVAPPTEQKPWTGIQGFLPQGKKATKLAIKMLCVGEGL